jgi:hypothetical protein
MLTVLLLLLPPSPPPVISLCSSPAACHTCLTISHPHVLSHTSAAAAAAASSSSSHRATLLNHTVLLLPLLLQPSPLTMPASSPSSPKRSARSHSDCVHDSTGIGSLYVKRCCCSSRRTAAAVAAWYVAYGWKAGCAQPSVSMCCICQPKGKWRQAACMQGQNTQLREETARRHLML